MGYQSSKIMSILRSGHHVEMDYSTHSDVVIRLRQAQDDEELAELDRVEFVEERFRNDERVQYREIHAPGIDHLVRGRDWSVNKQN